MEETIICRISFSNYLIRTCLEFDVTIAKVELAMIGSFKFTLTGDETQLKACKLLLLEKYFEFCELLKYQDVGFFS